MEKGGENYLKAKRERIMEIITPICDACNIRDYDYVVDDNLDEWLVLDGTRICCTATSVEYIIPELYGYMFIKNWKRPWRGALGEHQDDVLNEITLFWKK